MSVSVRDQTEFGARLEPFRRALHLHCYRLMGSVQDADDMVQETFLRAWRRREAIAGVASLRAWLYTIATNVCLDALKRRPRRLVPAARTQAATLADPFPRPVTEPVWLEPYPDALLPAMYAESPEEQLAAREHVTLAFMVALHRLPPRQRAVLLLQEVLEWPASDVATLLGTTTSAVKSALHRARAALTEHRTDPDAEAGWPLDSAARSRLVAYVRAWEAADIAALVDLLRDDATYSMPPIPAWYRGRETIRALLARTALSGDARGRWRLLPTGANGQPAFGLYCMAEPFGHYRPYGIQVLTMHGAASADITTFIEPALFVRFGHPPALPAQV